MLIRDDRIEALLDRWEESRNHGVELSAAELCRDHPELTGELRCQIEQLRAVDPFVETNGSARAEPDSLPNRIGPYRVLSEIDRGGMGVVYRCLQENPSREVAVKVMATWRATPTSLARFYREVKILGLLKHAGIAQIYDAGTANLGLGPQPFFAMELVSGLHLDRFAEERNLSTPAKLQLLTCVCNAVRYAHEHGVIHRDLKPANILVGEDGQPKVLDFGVARLTGGDTEPLTSLNEGQVPIGSLPYMSSEQACGSQDLDERCDVYALGVIAYQLLTGTMPFVSRNGTLLERLQAIREEVPIRLGTLNRSLRGELETIIAKALEKDRNLRYASVGEFSADILRYLRGEPIHARAASTWYVLWRWAVRNPLVSTLAASLLLLLITGLITVSSLLVIAEHRREQAEAKSREARATVDTMYTEVSKWLEDEPRSDEIRRRLLVAARDAYRRFDQEADTRDPAVATEAATAAFRLAEIELRLGYARQGRSAGHDALRRFTDLARRFPEQAQYRFDIFHCHTQLGNAAEAYETISALCRDISHPDYQDALAHAAARFGDHLAGIGEHARAEALFEEGLHTAEKLSGQYPENVKYRRHVATNLRGLGSLRYSQGRFPQSLELFERAADCSRQMIQASPQGSRWIVDLGLCLQGSVVAALSLSDLDRAAVHAEEWHRISVTAATERPDVFASWQQLHDALSRRLEVALEANDQELARPVAQEYVDTLETIIRKWPSQSYMMDLALFLADSEVLEARNAARAKEVYDSLSQRGRDNPDCAVGTGVIQLRLGNHRQAIQSLNQASRDCPVESGLYLAVAHAALGNWASAHQAVAAVRLRDDLSAGQKRLQQRLECEIADLEASH